MEIVDGRHRAQAYEFAGKSDIPVEIVQGGELSLTQIVSMAYKANSGGPLPPTVADTEHTIAMLIKDNPSITQKGVAEVLGIRTSWARKLMASVRAKMTRKALSDARAAITNGGLTLPQAAKQYELNIDQLRDFVNGNKKKEKGSKGNMRRELTARFRSFAVKNAAQLRDTIEAYQDGDATQAMVDETFKHIKNLLAKSAKSVDEWQKRYEALKGSGSKTTT